MASDNGKAKVIAGSLIVVLGVVGRFFLVEYVRIPNFEIITALSLVAGMYLGGIYAVMVPVSIVFLSDIVIGNGNIIIFTWSAFAIIGIIGAICKNKARNMKPRESMIVAIISSIFFFIYTNFGWWLMSGMYEYSISGLANSYAMALPFFRNQIIGNVIFVPIAIYFAKYASKYQLEKWLSKFTQIFRFKNNQL